VPEMNFNKGGVTGGKVQLEISGQLQAEQFPGVNPCNHNDGRRPTVALGVSHEPRLVILYSVVAARRTNRQRGRSPFS